MEEQQKKEPPKENNEIKLINQGTFGCIYRPYAQC